MHIFFYIYIYDIFQWESRVPSTIICKYFFSPVCFPLLIQSLKLNSWKSREVVPVTPIRQIPSGSWQQPSRPLGEEHPACSCLAAPCTFLGLFQPLPGAEQPAGKPNRKTHERFAATVTGDIFILLKYLLWVNVSCPAEMCAAASQKNPILCYSCDFQLSWSVPFLLFPGKG